MTRDTHSDGGSRSYRQFIALFIAFMMVASGTAAVAAGSTGTPTSDTSPSNSLTTQASTENGTVYAGSDGNNLIAFDAQTGDELWSFTASDNIQSSPTVTNGTVFFGSYDGNLYAVDAETGTERWSAATGQIEASPTIVDGTVYIGSTDNNLYAIDESTGQQEWTYTTGNNIHDSSPNVVDGTVYIGSNDNSVYAINATDGTEEWNFATGNSIWSSPTADNGTVYFGSLDDNLYAVNTSTGTEEWSYTTGGDVWSSPIVSGGNVYVGSRDGSLYSVSADTGTEQWSHATGSSIADVSPTLHDGTVFIGSNDNNLYAVDADTGTEEWSYSTGDSISESSPTFGGGMVYIGTYGFDMYGINANTGTLEWVQAMGGTVKSSPTYVSSGSEYSDGTRVESKALGHHDHSIHRGTNQITGDVTDTNGTAIGGATVTFANTTTGTETSTQTDSSGMFSINVADGEYDIEISKGGYQTVTLTRDITADEHLGTFELAPYELDLKFNRYVEPNSTTPYEVVFIPQDGPEEDVTANVSMNSSNASIATANESTMEIVGAEGVNGTAEITATYTVDGETFQDTRTVTVATKTVDNLEILPGTWRFSAVLDDITMQVLLVAIGAGIVATRAASSWAGLGAMELVLIIGWFADWVPIGIAMLGLFTALFIGLNLAANIDYSVRQ